MIGNQRRTPTAKRFVKIAIMQPTIHLYYSPIGAMGVGERMTATCIGSMKASRIKIRLIIFVSTVGLAFACPQTGHSWWVMTQSEISLRQTCPDCGGTIGVVSGVAGAATCSACDWYGPLAVIE